MKLITRTFSDTEVKSGTVEMVDGKAVVHPLKPFTINDRIDDDEKLRKIVKKKYGVTAPIVITEITHTEYTRAMPVEMFIEHSEPIENFKK